MSIRPPKALAPKDTLKPDPLSAALEHEVLAEKAATYARLVEKLQKALARLQEHERRTPSEGSDPSKRRSAALQDEAVPNPAPRATVPRGEEGRRRVTNHEAASDDAKREALLNDAGSALWYVMIQRDLCGFRRHDLFYKELNVPAAVRRRMGISRSR